jgi:ATPase subunit of ABC transporter with duplicated ATPase domains
MLCDVAVHDLAAGQKSLLQKSRNEAGHQASSMAHLNCRLRLRKGERHLLLGKNGCGKTTLLQAIARQNLEDWPANLSVFLVEQETGMDLSSKPLDAVLAADKVMAALEKEATEIEEAMSALPAEDAEATAVHVESLNAVYEKLYEEDEGQRQQRAVEILRGLGFESDMLEKPLNCLSGGWQMRVALAAGLFMKPELLLLDEPTTQLDLVAIKWLQEHLAHHYQGTILCVSHDRTFINEVATELILFADQCLDYFTGNLDDFDKEAAKSMRNMQRQVAALEKKREHVQKSIDHMVEAAAKRDENRSHNKDHTKYASMQGGFVKNNGQVAQRIKKLGRMGLEKNRRWQEVQSSGGGGSTHWSGQQ